jgi:D-alanine-D-alanine ligase
MNTGRRSRIMPEKVVIIYNEPAIGPYHQLGEGMAVEGVVESVKEVQVALSELGYQVQILALSPPLSLAEAALRGIEADLVFNLFEGFDGWPESEAAIAQYLKDLGLCYTGCSSHTLRVCENKATMKSILSRYGIATPEWQVLYPGCAEKFNLSFPCIVKPIGEHASHGLSSNSVVHDLLGLTQQVEFIWQTYRHHSLVEKFLPGREFRATLIENHDLMVLPIEEIIYSMPPNKPKLLTYSAKWIKGDEYFVGTSEKCPADIDPHLRRILENIAKASFTAVGGCNYASIDLRQNENGELMVIDINPNTDISLEGGIKLPLEVLGMSYSTFIYQLISHSIRDRRRPPFTEPDMDITKILEPVNSLQPINNRAKKKFLRETVA